MRLPYNIAKLPWRNFRNFYFFESQNLSCTNRYQNDNECSSSRSSYGLFAANVPENNETFPKLLLFVQFLILILLLVLFLSFQWSFCTDLWEIFLRLMTKQKASWLFYCYSYYDILLHHLESDTTFINLCQGRKNILIMFMAC